MQADGGVCIGCHGKGMSKACTVRKISYRVGVERIFPIHSPRIDKVDVVRRGRVRRAKLNYLRERAGKAAKVDELIVRKDLPNRSAIWPRSRPWWMRASSKSASCIKATTWSIGICRRKATRAAARINEKSTRFLYSRNPGVCSATTTGYTPPVQTRH